MGQPLARAEFVVRSHSAMDVIKKTTKINQLIATIHRPQRAISGAVRGCKKG